MAPQNPRDMREYMRIIERLVVQQRGLPALVGNAVKVIEDKTQETQARHPAAPIELNAQTAVYLDSALRRHMARLSLDFPDVTFNTDGTKATIQQYELWGYQEDPAVQLDEDEAPWVIQSINTESVLKVDGFTQGSLWRFRARALGVDAVQPGEWSDSITVQMLKDTTPPPQPTPPQLTISHGTITVTWDRLAVSGEMPADFSHLIVAAGTTTSPEKETHRLDKDVPFYIHTGAKYHTPMFFRFRAVDESGNLGPWSAQATGFTTPLVDVDVILSEIDAGKTRIINAGKIALDANTTLDKKLTDQAAEIAATKTSLTGPGGLTSRLVTAEGKLANAGALVLADGKTLQAKLNENAAAIASTDTALTGPGGLTSRIVVAEGKLADVGALTYATGQTLRQKLTANDTALSAAQGQLTVLRDTTIPDLTSSLSGATGRLTEAEGKLTTAEGKLTTAQGDLTKLTNRVSPLETGLNTLTTTTIPAINLSINGKTTIVRATSAAANPASYSLGDRWEKWSSLGIGGKLLQTWRHNSTAWVEEILDASYLPLVDIGSATFGELGGGRITTGSLTTKHLLVGSSTNLVPNGSGEWGQAGAWAQNLVWDAADKPDGLPGSFYAAASGTTTPPTVLFDVEPNTEYRFELWIKADKPSSRFYLELRDQAGAHGTTNAAITGQASAAAGGYPVSNYLVPTEWTKLTAVTKTNATVNKLKVGGLFFNHTSGTERTASVWLAGLRLVRRSEGSLLVDGSVSARQVDAEGVAAAVGTFLRLTTDQLTAGSANLGDAVARKIAAGTAAFQTVDAKNLFVTGTSSLGEAVAKRFAADTGEFLSLGVEQLKVTGTANMSTAVADRMFANIFATNKLTANELVVGTGENLIPWMLAMPGRSTEPHRAQGAAVLKTEGNGGRNGSAHVLMLNETVTTGTFVSSMVFRSATSMQNMPVGVFPVLPNTKYKLSVWVRSGGTYPNGAPNVRLNVGFYDGAGAYANGPWYSPVMVLPSAWTELVYEFTTYANHAGAVIYLQQDKIGHIRIDTPSLVKDGASLIATGGIVADHITASEELSAKAGQFLTLGVDKLTVAGTANLQTAVANRMFANIFATNRLTASQVLIGEGGNFLGDPNFLDPAGWSNGASWITALAGRNGNNAYVIPASTAQAGGYYGSADRNRQFTVVPDTAYRISVWVKPDAAVPVKGVAMYMKWSTPTGPASGTGFSEPGNITNDAALAAGVWAKISGIVKLPAEAVKGFIGIFVQANANVRVAFSEPSVIQAVDQGLIVDNGILARHITASEEMSAKVGQFLKLNVTDLVATGSAKINEAVITKLFTETFATNKLTAQQVVIGSGLNVIPDPGHLDAAMTAARNAASTMTVSASSSKDLTLTPAATATTFFHPLGVPTTAYKEWIPVLPGQVWKWGLTVVQMKSAAVAGSIVFLGRNQDGTASVDPVEYTTLPAGNGSYSVTAEVPAGCYWLYPEMRLPGSTAGATYIDQGSMFMTQVMDSSLIVDGAVTTKKLTVTEDMTVALLKAHKVKAAEIDVNSLIADTAFIGSMRTKILVADVVTGTMIAGDTITGDLIKGDAIGAKHTLTGPVIRTAASGARLQLDSSGLRGWTTAGVQYLTANGTGITAIGKFTAKDESTSITLGPMVTSGIERPGLQFSATAVTSQLEPQIFMEGETAGAYPTGALVLVGSEKTINSTGRSEIILEPNGGGGQIATSYGPYSGTGLLWAGEGAFLLGRMINNSSHARAQIRGGVAPSGFVPGGTFQEWTITVAAPPPNGQLLPFVSLDAGPGVGQMVSPTVNTISRTGFRCRVAGYGANMSTQVAKLMWFAIWTN